MLLLVPCLLQPLLLVQLPVQLPVLPMLPMLLPPSSPFTPLLIVLAPMVPVLQLLQLALSPLRNCCLQRLGRPQIMGL